MVNFKFLCLSQAHCKILEEKKDIRNFTNSTFFVYLYFCFMLFQVSRIKIYFGIYF